jgi:glycosyltransferase involved in cell wall biosynthesis
MKSILILLHCESNTGYAIAPLELAFFKMATRLCDDDISRIHFAYPSMQRGPTASLPSDFTQYAVIDSTTTDNGHCLNAEGYIRQHGIDTIFGFDQRPFGMIYKHFRRAGVRSFVSYWGAPMSSVQPWPIRMAKRATIVLNRNGPDRYIFESKGMADFATLGRGIPPSRVSVVYPGVDTAKFHPDPADREYIYEQFQIPEHRKVFFYSGHMEHRKGVWVIMEAANRLAAKRDDWHIVLCGNKGNEAEPHIKRLSHEALPHVTFAGYRSDIPRLHRGCYAAVIASSGWDSFTMSSLEMQASGLPLVVSDLPGLRETIALGRTGSHFRAGDAPALAGAMEGLLDDAALRDLLSQQARQRCEQEFNLALQLESLEDIVRQEARRGQRVSSVDR